MTPERWKQVKSVLEQAIEVPTAARANFLDEACGDNTELRREIESLLDYSETENDLLENNAFSEIFENSATAKKAILPGMQIGNYKIAGELGAGGMGAVYLATRADGAFEQRAALKIVKRGMDSEAVLRRFFRERRILAALNHPNIARLLDGGSTPDGLPYFVMEYVEGETVTEYAERKNLSLAERLELFREICAAVSFAHANLVIHRDLKPSNILVTEDGSLKLLDFGIAKLLTNETDGETSTQGMQIFTPEYASPEQVRGEKLTTSTDIYSLGGLLYELLTGSRPYQTGSRNIGEIIRAVCETEPKPPSAAIWDSRFGISDLKETSSNGKKTASNEPKTNPKSRISNPKLLRGDLDNVILKALRKESERRYSSVEQFSEDVRRYLDGLPVLASKDTWRYRAAKFARRNRRSVAFSALIFLAIIGGIAGTSWQAVRAERERDIARLERDRAERRSAELRKMSNSLVNEIERAIRDLPGSLPARKILLTRAAEQLDTLAAESDNNTDLQLELIWAYQNLGDLQDMKLSERKILHDKALALTEKVFAAGTAEAKLRDRLAMLYLDMLVVSRQRGDVDFTVEYNQKSVAIVDGILREAPTEPEYQDSFWTANYHYALTLQQLGRASEVVETGRKILPVAEELYRTEPPGTDKYNFMKPHLTHTAIGYGLSYTGDYRAAVIEFQTALEQCRAEQVKRPDQDILRRNEANILHQYALAVEELGDSKTALSHAQTALSIFEKLAAANPTNRDFQLARANAEHFHAQRSMRQNQSQNALPRLRRALAVYEKLIADDAERIQYQILAARAKSDLGGIMLKSGQTAEAIRLLREAAGFYEANGAAKTKDAHLKRYFAETCMLLGEALEQSAANSAEAVNFYRRSSEIWQDLQAQGTLKHTDLSKPGDAARRLRELESRI